MDHLDEVAGAARSAVQITAFGGRGLAGAAGGTRRRLKAGRDRGEDRVETADRLRLAADHQAEAALEAEDPPAGTNVDEVDALRCERLGAVDVVAVVAVAAVDDDVVRLEHGCELVDDQAGDCGRHHHPDRARLVEFRDELFERGSADRAFAAQELHRVEVLVVDDALVAVTRQPPHEIGAHAAEADHPKLHLKPPSGRCRCDDGGSVESGRWSSCRGRASGWNR